MDTRQLRAYGIAAVALLAFLFLSITFSASQHGTRVSAATGLQNPGFEGATLGGFPDAWDVAQPVPDTVKVVQAEGPADFPTYADMGNITVSPHKGSQMLRLGQPKRIAEAQSAGANTVSQTFTASQSTLKFSFRVFSWEFRGNDRVGFNLTGGGSSVGTLAQPVSITQPNGSSTTCSALPCEFAIATGNRQQFLDSGWLEVEITSIPTDQPLTLTYFAGGAMDSAFATWAYFDNVNSPPVAKFTFAPAPVYEGTLLQFTDRSFDPDPEDTIVDWHWDIAGDLFEEQHPFQILPDEGTYTASLTVTSSDGTSTTVSTGGTALDGTPIDSLNVLNGAPVLSVLNVEALAGQPAPLLGRFADRGWDDTHTAAWSVGGQSPAATLQEDNLPILSVGRVDGSFTTSSSANGTLTVTDNDGGSASAPFGVTVVAADAQRHEPNGGLTGAPVLTTGTSYLSWVGSEGDVDIFEVKLASNASLPAGTQILASLTGLPADYDVIVLTQAPGDPQTSRFAQSDFGQMAFDAARFAQSRFAQSRFAQSRFAQSRFAQSRFAQSRFAQSAFSFSDVPLEGVSFTGYDAEQIGGTDISLEELGLGSLAGTGVEVAGFSANRGLDDDGALARSDSSGTRMYVAVVGQNGAHSAAPYRLSLEASTPPDLAEALGAEVCSRQPLVGGGDATSAVEVLYQYPGASQTLFVTQRERLRAIHSLGDEAWANVLNDMIDVADQPSVAGTIISLPSDIYDTWDSNPCDIDAVNALSADIKSEVQSRLGGMTSVVFIGDDDIVPYKRVPDETIIGNERDYTVDAFLKPGGALLASIVLGYNKSDDYYVDSVPTSWQGRELYLPDVAIGRLVETPDEIRGQLQAFVASNGSLNPQTGFVAGYDFFQDGAQEMADNLNDAVPTETLIGDAWTAADLRCQFLGDALPGASGCDTPDVAAPNAHFTHYSALSAAGHADSDFTDTMDSTHVAAAGGGSAFNGAIVFSMGCHAGLSVPDRASQDADAGIGINPALDFAQAMAQQRAVYIASTGFGYGDDEGIGGTEKLLALFSQDLVSGQFSAGQALVEAKRDYISGLAAPTVYDEKSSIQTVFYGLPMYQVTAGSVAALNALAPAGVPAGNSTITLIDGGAPTTHVAALEQVDEASGSYFSADGDTAATAGRPVQPKVALPLAASPSGPVRGAVLTGGAYHDISGFDPLIARPTNEWELDAAEPQICLPSFWPADVGRVNGIDQGGELQQTFVGVPGQFRCTSGPAANVTGLQRIYDSLTFELLRCATADETPPAISEIDIDKEGSDALVTVHASDAGGVQRIVALKLSGGTVTPFTLNTGGATSGEFTITIPNVTLTDDLIVQVDDGCNVATATAKGANISALGVDAGPDQLLQLSGPNVLPVTIENFNSLVAPVFYMWDFGDGTSQTGVISPAGVTIDGSGNGTFTVQHAYAQGIQTPLTATVKIVDSGGAIGGDDVIITGCDKAGETSDKNADFIGCGTSNDGTNLNLTMTVAGSISNKVGYRVTLKVGATTYTLKYDGGKASGVSGLRATVSGNKLTLTMRLSSVGATKGTAIEWFVESQSGVKGEQSSGFPDRMPDAGVIPYTIK